MNYLQNEALKDLLISNGVLHEVNRTFFHPLGLALTLKYYDDIEKTELLMQQDNDPEGTVFGTLDKFKMSMFRDFANSKYLEREDQLGFIIQTRDFTEEDKQYKNNKNIKTCRLEIIFKYFKKFCFDMQKKFIKHHDVNDVDNHMLSKDQCLAMLDSAINDNDWVSVAAWALIIDNYKDISHEIFSLKMDNENGQ